METARNAKNHKKYSSWTPAVRLRFCLALTAGRLVAWSCRIFRRPATSLPGVVALKICPDIASIIAATCERVIAVTGTNGKTTTANLLAHILKTAGWQIAHNFEGANMLPGVTAALMRNCSMQGRLRNKVALLEVDEGSVGKVFSAVSPDLVVVTNYFRDQLDRYWELERTTGVLREALSRLPHCTLVLNGDDPLTASLGRGFERVVYYGVSGKAVNSGVSGISAEESAEKCPGKWILRAGKAGDNFFSLYGETREGRYCSFCGSLLQYGFYHFGQLGDYRCPECGFSRPKLDLVAEKVDFDRDRFTLRLASRFRDNAFLPKYLELESYLQGFYNVYNVLGAVAAALILGIDEDVIRQALLDYRPATGRMEDFVLDGHPCTLALIKNPVGANEVLKTISAAQGEKALVVAINDLAADGRDVSWLWDADFFLLRDTAVKRIICSGRRAYDFAVCLKYSGVPLEKIRVVPERNESLKALAQQKAERYYVLVTYTNLFSYAEALRVIGREVG